MESGSHESVENTPLSSEESETITRDKRSSMWYFRNNTFPKDEAVFFSQLFIITIVVIAAVYNLTTSNGKTTLWTALLSSALGYILPNPQLRKSV